jgi:hypothetical protein
VLPIIALRHTQRHHLTESSTHQIISYIPCNIRFISVERINEEGYEAYLDIFIKLDSVKASVNKLKK